MTFGYLYESVEDIDIRVVDGEKSYYARVINPVFDYDAIADREIERIYYDSVNVNLVAELKYKPVITVKDLLSTCLSNKHIKAVLSSCTQYTRKARCIEIYGNRKVKSWTCDNDSIIIAIDGNIDTEL